MFQIWSLCPRANLIWDQLFKDKSLINILYQNKAVFILACVFLLGWNCPFIVFNYQKYRFFFRWIILLGHFNSYHLASVDFDFPFNTNFQLLLLLYVLNILKLNLFRGKTAWIYELFGLGHSCFWSSPGPATVNLIYTIENGSLPIKNGLFSINPKWSWLFWWFPSVSSETCKELHPQLRKPLKKPIKIYIYI